jgi:predicted phage tail component-like protein
MITFSFNGETREYIQVERGSSRPAWATVKRNLLTTTGRVGALLQSTDTDPLTLTIKIRIKHPSIKNMEDLQKVKEDLAGWLLHDEAKPLIMDDEPDRVYYAVVDGTIDTEDKVYMAKGSITFVALDGRKHALKEKTVVSRNMSGQEVAQIENLGTAETKPILRVTADAPYTHITLMKENGIFNQIGSVVDLEKYTAKKPKELIFHNSMATTNGWSYATGAGGFDGTATGTFASNGYSFQASSFGTVTDKWHGPVMKQSLGIPVDNPLVDFELEARIQLSNPINGLYGRVEVYLLDDKNEIVGKLALKNSSGMNTNNIPEARAGAPDVNHYLISSKDYDGKAYANFFGMMRLRKNGSWWEATFAQVNQTTGRQDARLYRSYEDPDGRLTRQPTQVAVHVGQYGSRQTALLAIHDVWVYRINRVTENDIPYIVDAGDEVEFDHVNDIIRINGEERPDLQSYGGDFFELDRGTNIIQSDPNLKLTCIYRERFK